MPTRQAATKVMEITLAHSPDSDDAFMFYALATRKVRTPGMRFTHVLADIETLNQAAPEELYDVTALSFPAYAFLRDKYVLLDCGASFGEGYGPILVASHPMKREELAGRRVAVPGLRTTAYLALHGDRKSTRLNSSHVRISYAVFCLRKKHILTLDATDVVLAEMTEVLTLIRS